MGMRKRVAVGATAAMLGLVALGTCTAAGERDDGGMQASVKTQALTSDVAEGGAAVSRYATTGGGVALTTAAAGADGGGAGSSTGESAAAPLPSGVGDPKVIKTAEIAIQVDEGRFDAVFSQVPTIVAGLGGFVSSSTSSSAEEGDELRQAAGSIVVRIPADQFDAARTELVGLGELRHQEVRGTDVSAQLTDLDARLRNLRSQEEAMRLLMTKANTLGETVEVQRELGNLRGQIEQLAAEQLRLSDAVAMSTLTVHLAEPGAAIGGTEDPSPVGAAFSRALRGAQDVVAGVIVSLGYLLPLALLAAIGWLAARPFLHRREATVASS